jgi:hypothetical protein
MAKVGGGAVVVGGGEVFEPFPGARGLNWRISRIDVGVWMGPWQLLECISPRACLFWCAHVQ